MSSENMGRELVFTIDSGKQRLDAALRDALASREQEFGVLSRETVKKAIAAGSCTVNGTVVTEASAKVRAKDEIHLTLTPPSNGIVPEAGKVAIVYEDADIVVCDKDAGLTVHPCPSCPTGTLVQRLASCKPEILSMEGERPGIVHRIDKDTSGLIAVALNESARLRLSEAFAERKVAKEYLALVSGVPPRKGSCDEPIGRDPTVSVRMAVVPCSRGGREAHTVFERVWTDPECRASLVRVRILTGRTHQIRVHMTHLGHPLLGDAVYAPAPIAAMAPRQMLHAWHISFDRPGNGETVTLSCPPPADFRDCILGLGGRMQALVVTGNPGSGKSTVSAMLAERNIPCISADQLVSGYYSPRGPLPSWLCARLGDDVLTTDGSIDRTVLMAAFQNRPDLRREVEDLVHGLVLGDIREFFDSCARKGYLRCAAEIPLYFECGWQTRTFEQNPLTIGVRAGRGTRQERLAQSRGWSEEKSSSIESWQWEEERKIAACDLVIDNTADTETLRKNVDALLARLDNLVLAGREELARQMDELWNSPWNPEKQG